MIHIVTERVTPQQMKDMCEALQTYVKLAVDVQRRVVAGGGALHADCEAVLLEEGSLQQDIWGADWVPVSQEVRFESLINIRPKAGNRSIAIADPTLRAILETIVRERFTSS